MVKPEPTKLCKRCGHRKPWSGFYVKVRWPDGTTRQPQSLCKVCQGAANRANREPQRRYDRKQYGRIRRDPEAWATRLENQRFQYRGRRGVVARVARISLDGQVMVDAAVFAEWLRWVVERDDSSITATAGRLGIGDKTMRRILVGQGLVDLVTVERALIADDTATLRDIYPDLYEVAA